VLLFKNKNFEKGNFEEIRKKGKHLLNSFARESACMFKLLSIWLQYRAIILETWYKCA